MPKLETPFLSYNRKLRTALDFPLTCGVRSNVRSTHASASSEATSWSQTDLSVDQQLLEVVAGGRDWIGVLFEEPKLVAAGRRIEPDRLTGRDEVARFRRHLGRVRSD